MKKAMKNHVIIEWVLGIIIILFLIANTFGDVGEDLQDSANDYINEETGEQVSGVKLLGLLPLFFVAGLIYVMYHLIMKKQNS